MLRRLALLALLAYDRARRQGWRAGLWLGPAAPEPAAVLREREFAHIHPDGSLHLVLPVDRAREAIDAKWAEFHPWVGRDDFWDGMVMLYTPQSDEPAITSIRRFDRG